MKRVRRRTSVAGAFSVLCLAVAVFLAGSVRLAVAASSFRRVGVVSTIPAGSRIVGALAASAPIDLTIALEPRDPAGLAAFAGLVSTPGSPDYHGYLSAAQFAQRFGATTATVRAVESSLSAHGLDPGPVSVNGLSIPVRSSAGKVARALSVGFHRVALSSGRVAYLSTSRPAFDASIAGQIQGVLGLDSLSEDQPLAIETKGGHMARSTPHVVTGGPQPCSGATGVGLHTADQIASAYEFSPMYMAGDLGAGETVALFETEGNFPADISTYQSCYGTSASVTYQEVDGGPPAPVAGTNGLETELDVEDIIGLAPRASIIVYQAPPSGSSGYDLLSSMISQDKANVISTSWGACEAARGSANATAENTLFQEAAAQGQSVFALAGDSGSESCSGALSVEDPASQPFVTGVGGTKLTAVGPRPTESVWNESAISRGAGGGGISTLWPMPSYQSGAPASLNVRNANSSGTPCGAPSGSYCREVPDVSAEADPQTGYAIFYNGAWIGVGGTSAATPTWAAFAALTDASSACGGAPIGFANPALYEIAGSSAYTSAFNDITSGNNDYTPGVNTSGPFPAGTGYDMASGLGTPVGSTLAASLCADEVRVSPPGAQSAIVGKPVSVPVSASSQSGLTISYSASSLPPGLSIDSSTGLISGTPTSVGQFTTTITARDTAGVTSAASVTWSVVAPAVTITALAAQRGIVGKAQELQITAADSNDSAPVFHAQGLPAGLSINPTSGIVSGTPTRAGVSIVVVTAADSSGLASATTDLTWTISGNPTDSHASLGGLAAGHPKLSFTITSGTNAPAISTITIALPRGLSFSHKAKAVAANVGAKGPRGNRLKLTTKLSHGVLTIRLKTATTQARVTIAYPAIRASAGLIKKARRKRAGTLGVTIHVSDSSHQTTALSLRLKTA
jgi:subtilase family serine protease